MLKKVAVVLGVLIIMGLSVWPTWVGHKPLLPPHPGSQVGVMRAIEIVESGCDPLAIGDGGEAVGILQIHPIMVEDVNRILELNRDTSTERFTIHDRTSRERSEEMFRIYTSHYTPDWDPEKVARRWNGGPRGDRRSSTLRYWHRVQKELVR